MNLPDALTALAAAIVGAGLLYGMYWIVMNEEIQDRGENDLRGLETIIFSDGDR